MIDKRIDYQGYVIESSKISYYNGRGVTTILEYSIFNKKGVLIGVTTNFNEAKFMISDEIRIGHKFEAYNGPNREILHQKLFGYKIMKVQSYVSTRRRYKTDYLYVLNKNGERLDVTFKTPNKCVNYVEALVNEPNRDLYK